MWSAPDAWEDFGTHLEGWIEDVASALARASVAAISVIDFEAILIDGAMPAAVRDRLTARTAQIFSGLDRRGLSDVVIVPATIGADARAIGGAALPLIKNFARDRELVFKDAMSPMS
jgi:predicted NBD/HSP70 family sugar kinase